MINFTVSRRFPLSPSEIVERILDPASWTTFTGYGPLPGIVRVEKTQPDSCVEGTCFTVENSDGSRHQERIVEYAPGQSLTLRLEEFSPPLSRFASHFMEHWTFETTSDGERTDGSTLVTRRFEFFGHNMLANIPLAFAAVLMKRAVQRHMETMTRELKQ